MNEEIFLNLIRDKKALLAYLLKQMQTSAKISDTLPQLRERGWSEQGVVDKLTEITALQSKQILTLTQLMLIYVQDDDFSASVAKMCVKMGSDPEAALRAMFDAKMNGR